MVYSVTAPLKLALFAPWKMPPTMRDSKPGARTIVDLRDDVGHARAKIQPHPVAVCVRPVEICVQVVVEDFG